MANSEQKATGKKGKKLGCIVYGSLFLLVFFMLYFWSYGIYKKYNPTTPAIRVDADKIKHVRVDGVDYAVPRGYFSTIVPYVTEDESIYLEVMYPDLTPLPDTPSNLFYSGEIYKRIIIMAKDKRMIKSLQEFAEFLIEDNGYSSEIEGEKYGLNTLKIIKKSALKNYIPYANIADDGKIIRIITCNTPETVNVPHCQHYFKDFGLRYELTYNRVLLPYWKDMEDKTLELFNNFRKQAKELGFDKVKIPEDRIDKRVLKNIYGKDKARETK